MTSETIPQAESQEIVPLPVPVYQESCNRLFKTAKESLDTASGEVFYQLEWDPENPQKIARVTTMSLRPTGARRQERSNVFYRAQFKTLEQDDDLTNLSSRFIWCSTEPLYEDSTPIFKPESLKEEQGFELLTMSSVVDSLASRAQSAQDYEYLLNVMGERNAEVTPLLAKAIQTVAYRLVNNELSRRERHHDNAPYGTEMFTLIRAMGQVDQNSFLMIRGRLISRLLGSLRNSGKIQDIASIHPTPEQQSAILTLEASLYEGIIKNNTAGMDRILSFPDTYSYDIGTEMLHNQLAINPLKYTKLKILNTERTIFTHDYMLHRLAARVREQGTTDDIATQTIRGGLIGARNARHSLPPVSFERLYEIAAKLERQQTGDETSQWDMVAMNQRLSNVSQAFEYVLSFMTANDPANEETYQTLNQKSVEIVDTLLYPLQLHAIGKRAVKKAVLIKE